MKSIPLAILLFLANLILCAQSQNPIPTNFSEQIPSSPEAMSFTKFGTTPINLSSGVIDLSIPLYTLQEGDINLPIALSYYNNGYRPAELAPNTGYGWTLIAGGMITRIVKGQVDENPVMTSPSNYYTYADLDMKYEDFPDIFEHRFTQQVLNEIADGKTDGEPDIYQFNVNGISGNFIIKNKQAILIPHQNIKIDIKYETSSDISGNTFIITNSDGTRYVFGLAGIEESDPAEHNVTPIKVENYFSAWHLTSIQSRDNYHKVYFDYDTYTLAREDMYTDSYNQSELNFNKTASIQTSICYGATIHSKSLRSISTLSGKTNISIIDGELRTDVQDINNVNSLSKLGSIEIRNSLGEMIKKWGFQYSYFGSSPVTKLALKEIHLENNSGEVLDTYKFEYYNEEESLPENNTRGIDHWGYYNGENSNSNLIPLQAIPEGSIVIDNPANRTPNFNKCIQTVLSKVTYPTGGSTTFEYEANKKKSSSGNTIPQSNNDVHLEATYNLEDAIWDGDNYYVETGQRIFVCEGQQVNFSYQWIMPHHTSQSLGVKIFYPVYKIIKVDASCDDGSPSPVNIVYYRRTGQFYPNDPYGTYRIDGTVYLDPGTYVIKIQIDQEIYSLTSDLFYIESGQTIITPEDAPGLRVKTIKNIDKDNTTLLSEKDYLYTSEDGNSSGVGGGVQYPISYSDEYKFFISAVEITHHESIPGSMQSNVSSIFDNKFYYTLVTELEKSGTVDHEVDLKTEYYYKSFDDYHANERLFKQVEYSNINGEYHIIHSKMFNYEIFTAYNEKDILSLKSSLKSYITYGEQYANALNFPNDDDQFDPIQHLTMYKGTGLSVLPGYILLTEEVNKDFIYYDKSNLSKVDPVISTITYQYTLGQIPYHPFLIQKSTSDGDAFRDEPLCCFDYDLLGVLVPTPLVIDKKYNTDLNTIIGDFELAPTNFGDYFNSYNLLRTNRNLDLAAYWNSFPTHINSEHDINNKGILYLQSSYVPAKTICQNHYILKDGVSRFLGAEKIRLGVGNTFNNVFDREIQTYDLKSPIPLNQINNSNFETKLINTYDIFSNLTSQTKNDGIKHTYLWGYGNMYPIAEIINGAPPECGYLNFENETLNWDWMDNNSAFVSTPGIAKSGTFALKIFAGERIGIGKDFDVSRFLDKHSGYMASVWVKGSHQAYLHIENSGDWDSHIRAYNTEDGDGWHLIEVYYPKELIHTSSNPGPNRSAEEGSLKVYIGIEGGEESYFDDLRFFPMDASMTTYTYKPLIGITSSSDQNNKPTTYEYDSFDRLHLIRDFEGNILKKINYHYYNQ